MGHRCNYLVIANGKRTLYASNWGALTIVRDFFWGLEPSLRFLDGEQQVDEADGWYDDVFGEGAAAIHIERAIIAINGGEIDGRARKLAVEMMKAIWARDGFTVLDLPTLADVVEAVGVSSEPLQSAHMGRPPLKVDDPQHSGRATGRFACLITVDGVQRFCFNDDGLFEAGPALLAHVARLPDRDEAERLHGARSLESWEKERPALLPSLQRIDIDTKSRTLRGHAVTHWRRATRRHFEALWPGWTFAALDASAEQADGEGAPTEDAFAEVEQHVFRNDGSLARLVEDLKARAKDDGGWVNPLAARAPTSGVPIDVGRPLFAWAKAQVQQSRP